MGEVPTCKWELLTWVDVKDFCSLSEGKVILIPIGSVEQHGPLLPLGFDYILAYEVCLRSCENLINKDVKAVVLPPLTYGVSPMWLAYSGTVSVTSNTLQALVKDIIKSITSYCRQSKIVLVNGHAGNSDTLKVVARDSAEEFNAEIAVVTLWELCGDVINEEFHTKFFHADEIETSLGLALKLVKNHRMDLTALEPFRRYNEVWHTLDLTKRPKAYVYRPESKETHGLGAYGRPDLATESKGMKLMNCFVSRLVLFIEDFLKGVI